MARDYTKRGDLMGKIRRQREQEYKNEGDTGQKSRNARKNEREKNTETHRPQERKQMPTRIASQQTPRRWKPAEKG